VLLFANILRDFLCQVLEEENAFNSTTHARSLWQVWMGSSNYSSEIIWRSKQRKVSDERCSNLS